jgi:hypothetical protein
MRVEDELNEVGAALAQLKYNLVAIKFELKLRKRSIAMKAGFDPEQPRDELGMWSDGGGNASSGESASSDNQVLAVFADLASFPLASRIAKIFGDGNSDESEATPQTVGAQITYDTARTGITTIDETTEKLSSTLIDTMNRMEFIPDQVPNVYGVAVHTNFAASVRLQNLPGIGYDGVEETFSLTEVRRYGIAGSIRTDVTLRNDADEIIAIYDVKTGGAKLTASRADELRERTKAGPYTPVIELHFHRGSSLKHEQVTQDIQADPAAGAWHRAVRRPPCHQADNRHRARLLSGYNLP